MNRDACVVEISNIRHRFLWSPSSTVLSQGLEDILPLYLAVVKPILQARASWVSNTESRRSVLGFTGNILPCEPFLNHGESTRSHARTIKRS